MYSVKSDLNEQLFMKLKTIQEKTGITNISELLRFCISITCDFFELLQKMKEGSADDLRTEHRRAILQNVRGEC
ncbi:MAG: hypothetical protein ACTSPP_10495 [Candidatus Heimdallarchaeaceae archaeon]